MLLAWAVVVIYCCWWTWLGGGGDDSSMISGSVDNLGKALCMRLFYCTSGLAIVIFFSLV